MLKIFVRGAHCVESRFEVADSRISALKLFFQDFDVEIDILLGV